MTDVVERANFYIANNAAESGADVLIAELAAEIERLRAASQWQPIATVPIDGRRIIAKAVTFAWDSDTCQNVATGHQAIEAWLSAGLGTEFGWRKWCGTERSHSSSGILVLDGWIEHPDFPSPPTQEGGK